MERACSNESPQLRTLRLSKGDENTGSTRGSPESPGLSPGASPSLLGRKLPPLGSPPEVRGASIRSRPSFSGGAKSKVLPETTQDSGNTRSASAPADDTVASVTGSEGPGASAVEEGAKEAGAGEVGATGGETAVGTGALEDASSSNRAWGSPKLSQRAADGETGTSSTTTTRTSRHSFRNVEDMPESGSFKHVDNTVNALPEDIRKTHSAATGLLAPKPAEADRVPGFVSSNSKAAPLVVIDKAEKKYLRIGIGGIFLTGVLATFGAVVGELYAARAFATIPSVANFLAVYTFVLEQRHDSKTVSSVVKTSRGRLLFWSLAFVLAVALELGYTHGRFYMHFQGPWRVIAVVCYALAPLISTIAGVLHGAYADRPRYLWYTIQLIYWSQSFAYSYGLWIMSDPTKTGKNGNFITVAGGVEVPKYIYIKSDVASQIDMVAVFGGLLLLLVVVFVVDGFHSFDLQRVHRGYAHCVAFSASMLPFCFNVILDQRTYIRSFLGSDSLPTELALSLLIIILCVCAIVIIDPLTQRGLTESACQFGIPFVFFCMEYCNAALFVYLNPFGKNSFIFWTLFLLQEVFAMVRNTGLLVYLRQRVFAMVLGHEPTKEQLLHSKKIVHVYGASDNAAELIMPLLVLAMVGSEFIAIKIPVVPWATRPTVSLFTSPSDPKDCGVIKNPLMVLLTFVVLILLRLAFIVLEFVIGDYVNQSGKILPHSTRHTYLNIKSIVLGSPAADKFAAGRASMVAVGIRGSVALFAKKIGRASTVSDDEDPLDRNRPKKPPRTLHYQRQRSDSTSSRLSGRQRSLSTSSRLTRGESAVNDEESMFSDRPPMPSPTASGRDMEAQRFPAAPIGEAKVPDEPPGAVPASDLNSSPASSVGSSTVVGSPGFGSPPGGADKPSPIPSPPSPAGGGRLLAGGRRPSGNRPRQKRRRFSVLKRADSEVKDKEKDARNRHRHTVSAANTVRRMTSGRNVSPELRILVFVLTLSQIPGLVWLHARNSLSSRCDYSEAPAPVWKNGTDDAAYPTPAPTALETCNGRPSRLPVEECYRLSPT